ncbi:MAG: aldehyde dehydrogenase family protein [Beijerinckiaceae bacterium]|uniref:aldehyde dehydrogenase family protein n=1 Tax=Tabrizicola sp. TaxID=2005166 RepID=UPI003F39B08A
MADEFRNLIDGSLRGSSLQYEILNPANGNIVGVAPQATISDLDDAVAAARRAFPAWSSLAHAERQAYCNKLRDKLEGHADELARLLTLEQGKPLNGMGSRFELGGAQAWTGYTASLNLPIETLQDNEQGRIELHRKPIGVVGSVTPWNWPLMIAIWHVIPAILAGNTVVNKPSPFTPLSTLRMMALMNEVLPAGVINSVSGGDDIGKAMSSHAGIDKIVFTGSIAAGRSVMSSAAETMKRLTLELGGNDAGIVLPDADPAAIAEGLFWSAFINSGQTCAALKRLYVHDSIYEDVCEAVAAVARAVPVGDGLDEASALGPIQNQRQFDKVDRLVRAAQDGGGLVLVGGERMKREGLFFQSTIVANVEDGNPLVDEEQFGPVVPIIRYSKVDDAVARANRSQNGLGGSVWSPDLDAAKKVGMRLECGSVWLNRHGAIQPNAPFGGVKQSGIGVEFADEGLRQNTNIQVIYG